MLDGLLKSKPKGHYSHKIIENDEKNWPISDWFFNYSQNISEANGTKLDISNKDNDAQINRIKNFCGILKLEFEELTYDSDSGNQSQDYIWARSPLSLAMEIADDISYITSDLEDALNSELVSISTVKKVLKSCEFESFPDSRFEPICVEEFIGKYCKEHFSKLKSSLIRLMIGRVHLVMLVVNSVWKKANPKVNRLNFFNDLPFIWLAASIKFSDEKEIGNPLYFSEKIFEDLPLDYVDKGYNLGFIKNQNPVKLKSRLLGDAIVAHRSVAFENRLGEAALTSIVSELIPICFTNGKDFRKDVILKSSMLEEPFRDAITSFLMDKIDLNKEANQKMKAAGLKCTILCLVFIFQAN